VEYDLVVDTTECDPKEVADIIMSALVLRPSTSGDGG